MMVSLAGGLLGLDRIILQAMLSRPIVAGPLTGWLLDDPYTGLLCGAMIELLWIDLPPIGKYIPPNDTMTAVVVTAATIMAGSYIGQMSRELTVLALLTLLPVGYAGRHLDIWGIADNERLAKKALSYADASDIRSIEKLQLLAVLRNFASSAVFIFLVVLLGTMALIAVFPLLPPFVYRGLGRSYYFILLLGISVALATIKRKGAVGYFCAAFAVLAIIWEMGYGLFR